jgi:hypothetical protein
VIILSFSHLLPHYSPSFHSLSPSQLHLSFILYKQHNFQTASLAVQDMKAYEGGVTSAPLIVNGALGFGEWSVECTDFSNSGERAASTIRYLDPAWNQIFSTARGAAAIPTEVLRLLSTVYTTQIQQLTRRRAGKYFTEKSCNLQAELWTRITT